MPAKKKQPQAAQEAQDAAQEAPQVSMAESRVQAALQAIEANDGRWCQAAYNALREGVKANVEIMAEANKPNMTRFTYPDGSQAMVGGDTVNVV